MPDVPDWVKALVCLVLPALFFLIMVFVLLAIACPREPKTDLERDYDDGPRDPPG
ncbi:MAG TPA: hypothetical protein VFB89_03555 [Gemmatimonadales bacterium]|nr:hypothetical protein [Gemmatimonadales bacterium]